MTAYDRRRQRLGRLAIVFLAGAVFFGWLFYHTAHAADTPLLLSLYHDANHDGQRQASEPPAANFAYEWSWTDGAQHISTVGTTDANGMISTGVHTGTWTLTGNALHWQITVDGDVASAGQRDIGVGTVGLWLPQVSK